MRYQANILGIDIDTIVTRKSNAYLKFAWQIRWPIDWLMLFGLFLLDRLHLFPINPKLMIGFALRSKVHGYCMRNLVYPGMGAAGKRSRTGHNIAINIPTCRQCR